MTRGNIRLKTVTGVVFLALLSLLSLSVSRAQDPLRMAKSSTSVTLETTSWVSDGPYGGYVICLAIDETDPDVIYAGTESGIFKTVDGGANWTKTGFAETLVRVVKVASSDQQVIYAGTDEGIYKSEDGGITWIQTGVPGTRVNTIAIDPGNPQIVFIGTARRGQGPDGSIFKSTDGGGNWELKYSSDLDLVVDVLIDTDNSSYIYACGYAIGGNGDYKGFLKSMDGGETWVGKHLSYTGPWDDVLALAITPVGTSPSVIYSIAGGDGSVGYWSDVYRSTDRGESWTEAHLPLRFIRNSPIVVDPESGNRIYVVAQDDRGRLFRVDFDAGNYEAVADGLPLQFPSSLVINPQDGNVLYAGFARNGVYKSTDEAGSWDPSVQGLNNTYIEGLATHPTSSGTVFAAMRGYNLATTANGGTSWDYLAGSPSNLGSIAINPQNPSTIFAGQRQQYPIRFYLHKSTNGGQSWTDVEFLYNFFGTVQLGVSDIWIHPSDPSTMLLAVEGFGTGGGGVFRSTDAGATWDRKYSFWGTALAADPAKPGTVYFGTARYGYVLQSTDRGVSWTRISPGGEWVWEVRDLEVDMNSQVYAATDSGLIKWDGSDWTNVAGLPTIDITALAFDRSLIPEVLYVGTGESGIYVSDDGGNTWIPFNDGLESLSITELSISGSEPKMVYAGTAYGGVWSRSALITSVKSPELVNGISSRYELFQNYPNPFNPSTSIKFSLPHSGYVTLKVYNTLGEEIATLVSKNLSTGRYTTEWNASGFSSGVYFYRLQAGEFVEVRRLLLLK